MALESIWYFPYLRNNCALDFVTCNKVIHRLYRAYGMIVSKNIYKTHRKAFAILYQMNILNCRFTFSFSLFSHQPIFYCQLQTNDGPEELNSNVNFLWRWSWLVFEIIRPLHLRFFTNTNLSSVNQNSHRLFVRTMDDAYTIIKMLYNKQYD